MTSDISKSKTFRFFALSALLLAAVSAIAPTSFQMPVPSLDSAWPVAMIYSVQHGLSFGRDVLFTMGPMSVTYHKAFPGDYAWLFVLIDCVWVAVLVCQIYCLLFSIQPRAQKSVFIAISILLLLSFFWKLPFSMGRDALLFFVPAATAIIAIRKIGSPALIIAGIILAGTFSVAKFSVFIFSTGCFAVLDAHSIFRKKIPVGLVTFVATGILWFLWTGQTPRDYLNYIESSFEVANGFAAAMGLDNQPKEFRHWLMLAATLFLIHAVNFFRVKSYEHFLELVLLAWLLFILCKAGFVRHDVHSMTAWVGITVAVFFVASHPSVDWRGSFLFYIVLICALSYVVPLKTVFHARPVIQGIRQEFAGLFAFLNDYQEWKRDLSEQWHRSMQSMAQSSTLPIVDGSVDIIPNRQGELIAAGMKYDPRPTIQEYNTYTSTLIQRNREFFLSGKAPEFLLFSPGSIDDRHPATGEGSLWPLFLERYAVTSRKGDVFTLQRRASPLGSTFRNEAFVTGAIGAPILIPPEPGVLFVKIDIQYSIVGRLFALFKPPSLAIRMIYSDGLIEEYKLIPEIARTGSILVPTIKTSDDFDLLLSKRSGELRRPISFEILTRGRFGAVSYKPSVTASFTELDLSEVTYGR